MPLSDQLIDQLLADYNGSFKPKLIKKGEKQLSVFDERIVSLYARSKPNWHWSSLHRSGITKIQASANRGVITGQGLACSSIIHQRYAK